MSNYNSANIAKRLAESFGWKVFPVCRNSKKPCFRGWQDTASSNEVEIEKLFKPVPLAMIGVLTGPPNMLTVQPIRQCSG